MSEPRYFTKDDGRKLPVSDDYLLPFLNPTSPGTNYWEGPPPGPITDRQQGRAILQVHQLLSILQSCNVELAGKRFLDIGTGDGMIPKLMLRYSEISDATGIDPFRSGEHQSSKQAHDEDAAYQTMCDLIEKLCPEQFSYDAYRHLMKFQHHSMRPADLPVAALREKPPYHFEQIGAHDVEKLGQKFDVVYAKCIDHIPDWDGILAGVASCTNPDAVFVIKHFSFFSYLGPHRYATTNIPWGHLLMTDDEYRRFAHEFHSERAEKMIDFFFTGLSYPRTPMSELLRIAHSRGFIPQVVQNEPLRNMSEFHALESEVDGFWDIVHENHPRVSAEELYSGRYHVVLRRVA